jgi:hypothetical protein
VAKHFVTARGAARPDELDVVRGDGTELLEVTRVDGYVPTLDDLERKVLPALDLSRR